MACPKWSLAMVNWLGQIARWYSAVASEAKGMGSILTACMIFLFFKHRYYYLYLIFVSLNERAKLSLATISL